MKLIKIEEINKATNKSDINIKSFISPKTKEKAVEEETKVIVDEIPMKLKKRKIDLFPFGKGISSAIWILLTISCISIAYLSTEYDYSYGRKYFSWEDFYLNLSIIFIVECALYGIAVWKKNNIVGFFNMFKPQFGKGYNRLLTVSFVLIPWIIAFIFYIVEGFEEFLSALLITCAIECILYISILWVYKGFEEERKENKKKENINNKTNEL